MIEFSKSIDKKAASARSKRDIDKEKNSKRQNGIKSPLHYDFANNENKSPVQTGNSLLGDKIAEQDKIAKPAPAVSKFDKSKKLGDFQDRRADDFEMTKE